MFMISAVWVISGLVSVPPLFYPPWKIPLAVQKEDEFAMTEDDREILRELNSTGILAHSKCSVST